MLKQPLFSPILKENPVTIHVLGICSALAITNSLTSAVIMSIALTIVLVISNIVISLIRKSLPGSVRIIVQITIIASAVTIIDQLLRAFMPGAARTLSVYISLIVTNCIVLGRAEAFASKHPIALSVADGIGMGIGFTIGLAVLGICREVIGAGTITLWGDIGCSIRGAEPMILAILAPGGFIALGLLLGLMNHVQARAAATRGGSFTHPPHLDCRHCVICKWGE